MLRNELFNFVFLMLGLGLYWHLKLFNFCLLGVTILPDWISRLNPNDSLINSFNFFWTSFIYLPTFFFTYLLIFLGLYSNRSNLSCIVFMMVIFFFYNFEMVDFISLNHHWIVRDGSLSALNLLLANNLNKYHPFIFYISVFALTPVAYLLISTYQLSYLFRQISALRNMKPLLNVILLVNTFALFLGSWWALQEGTWGGWWNWDASEVLGLLVSLVSLQTLHTRIIWYNTIIVLERFVSMVILFIFSYFFIQLNFDLVSHNFGSKFFFFFNNNLFFLELLFVLSSFGFWKSIKLYWVRSQFITLSNFKTNQHLVGLQWLGLLTLFSLVTITLGSSFLPLLNYFIWSYFTVNSFNFHLDLPWVIASIFLIFVSAFISTRFISVVIIIIVLSGTYTPVINCLLFLITITWSFLSITHFNILLLLVINISSYFMNFVYWHPTMVYEEILFSQYSTYFKYEAFSCDNFFIDKINVYQSGNHSPNLGSWNTFYKTNAFNLNSFILQYDIGTYFNYYLLAEDWFNPALFIETNYLNNLWESLLCLTMTVSLFQYFDLQSYYY